MATPGKAQTQSDGLSTSGSPKVRTLHEPPDIWELVHETRVEFKPGSAFVSRLKSLNPLAMALVLLIITGGGVFGYMKLRDRPENQAATLPVQTESSKPKIVLGPQPTESSKTATVSDQPSDSAPPSAQPETRKIEGPKTAVAVPATPLKGEAAAKPRRDQTTAIVAKGATVAAIRPKEKARSASVPKTGSPTVARAESKNVSQGSTALAPKLIKEKGNESAAVKKPADKPLSPQLIAPAKASSTPKAKVIAWP